MNTRFDYEHIRDNNLPGWQEEWYRLLDGRWVVTDNELVEDANAKIFRIGMTVAEVSAAINHEGYTARQVEWYQSQSDRYELVAGEYVQVAGWAAAKVAADAAEAAEKAAFEQRVLDIIAAKEASGLKQYTVAQATKYINDKLNAASTVAQTKEAVREILLKMVPYLL